jgi:beta-xylosidase
LVDNTYHAYGTTNGNSVNIRVMRSPDLVTWEELGDALPDLPQWAMTNGFFTWAPGVMQIEGQFVMYYVARDKEADLQCIGVATSADPAGPFTDPNEDAFICQSKLGGSIDAYPFRDENDKLYLFWKNDGNCCGLEVALWVRELSPDGLTLVGEPVKLIVRDQPWERPLIENPSMVKHNDQYYLFYSGNWWESHTYAVGYAACETVTGPCEKPLDEPWFPLFTMLDWAYRTGRRPLQDYLIHLGLYDSAFDSKGVLRRHKTPLVKHYQRYMAQPMPPIANPLISNL